MIPHISDKGRRALRTALQVLSAFLTFAAVYPLIVAAIGAPTGSRVGLWLASAGAWLTAAAAIITRLMAIPAVDQILTLLGVGSIPRGQVQVSLKAFDPAAGDVLDEEVPNTAPALATLEDIEAAVAPDPEPAAAPEPAPVVAAAPMVARPVPVDPTVSPSA